jgi:acetylornithine deacetylase/succinyl-diaminopimelate desuccinylase-like protein
MKLNNLLFLFLLIFSKSFSQKTDYEKLAFKYGKSHYKTLYDYLSIPCDANYPEDIFKNIEWVKKEFEKRNFQSKTFQTPSLPVLLFEKQSANKNAKTIMFYYHSDGQPVKKSEWNQEDPYKPELKKYNLQNNSWDTIPFASLESDYDPEWRIFARASSDDKGPGVMLLAALDAIQSINQSVPYNLKVLVDFEEEKGSVHLPSVIDNNKKELFADLLLIFDGPGHASNMPTLTFGARGIATLTLTTYGPSLPLHSGHYGNYVPNPALRMAQLLAGMKDEDGRVLIPGFYENVKTDAKTLADLEKIPEDLDLLNAKLGIKMAEKVGFNYQSSLLYPSLNIRGLKSGEVGVLAATIIPNKAVAEIDIRTVATTPPDYLLEKVKNYIVSKGYHIVNNEPTEQERLEYHKICKIASRPAYGAFNTDPNGKEGAWLEQALSKTNSQKVIKLPTMGGSVPISPFVNKLGVTAVIVPVVNSDNNQHSANENLRLGNYFMGIQTMIGILSTNF